ncbi:Heme peroxidase [Dirofilaria immitis]
MFTINNYTWPYIKWRNEDEQIQRSSSETTGKKRQTDINKLINRQNIITAIREARDEIDKLFNHTEVEIFKNTNEFNGLLAERTWNGINKIESYSKKLSYSSQVSIVATEKFYNLTWEQISHELPLMDLRDTIISDICPINLVTQCPSTKYRTYSGHCNNVNHPLWGASSEPMQRFLKPTYADKISKPRISINGSSLPSARKISHNLITEPTDRHTLCSMMIAEWAMFIYEDIIHTGITTLYKGNESKPLLCCNQKFTHPECYPIEVDQNDTSYSTLTQCLPYVRTATSPRENCSLGPREQVNQVTSFLDASNIYGSNVERANKLRAYRNGLLLTQQNSRQNILLPNTNDGTCWSNKQRCFLSGGEFTNLFPNQIALHTIWLRQHNNIAKQLKAINADWDDEKLFQESRRIVIAQIQHITYNEFLPIIVGKNNLRQYGIKLRHNDYDSDYDLKTDATALNEFASAVGLFFYSLFSDRIVLYEDYAGNRRTEKAWNTLINDPELFYSGKIDTVLRYLLHETISKPGLHMNKYFKNEFLRGKGNYGLDLAAMIIQMGRDHGIPGYTAFRSACGLRRPTGFNDLADIILQSIDLDELARLYDHIDDVDLFVLGMAEKPELGALVGPTFACIIGKQFQKIRRGDRFWYENFFVPSAFTLEQLGEIRRTTLARIICDNSQGINEIQPNVFTLADIYGNCPMHCNSTIIDTIDLTQWVDQEPRLKLPITKATLEKAVRLGAEHAKRLNEAEADRIRRQGRNNNANRNRNLAIYAHSNLLAPTKESLEISHRAEILREATKVLLRGDGLSEQERLPLELDLPTLQRLLPEVDVSYFVGNITDFLGEENPSMEECLPRPLPCDHTTKYRTFSGWCNNLKFPHYGNAFAPMRRLLDPVYEDGFDSPRTMSRNRGRKLPSARKISNIVHAEAPLFHAKYTHMLMQMGQIIDHDFAHSPVSRGPGNTILDCSRCDSAKTISIHCFPIPIENGDPYFPHLHNNGEPRCIAFTRSLLGQLTLGYRNQLDQLTSYIDASFIYGSTECEANKLRLFSQGRLNFTDLGFNREALPQGRQERDCRSQPRHPCFNAGDERSNEQPGLTVMHTLFLREHNRIAASLSRINNFWSDEKIYLETRRIMGAKIQHIVYNEWLPIVLGCEATARYDLVPRKTGYYKGYDDKCDPTMTQEMATAAFRFGHSLIRNIFPRMNAEFHEETDGLDLKASFNNETFYYSLETGHIESVIMGLLGSHSMGFDRHISDAVRNHLFQKSADPYTGMDLPALNIQRGRDHGIPPYNSYREMCGMHRARNFDDLKDVMDNRTITAFRKVYDHVDDIDLFPGMMSERPLKGALVGPMLTCIIGEQFQRLKRCDRFFYENDNPATKFTPDQLAEIRKTTLSKLICANSQYARRIQPNAFLMPDDLTNAPMKCSELPDIDLYEWLDRQFCVVDHRVINLGRTKRITPCITCTCTAEGPECHSMVIDRCESLLTDYLFSEVIADTVCVIQCSSLIRQRSGQL